MTPKEQYEKHMKTVTPEWVDSYNSYVGDNQWRVFYKKEEDKVRLLLEECLHLLNEVPNIRYTPKNYSNSYDLASEISKYLNK